MEKKTRKQSKYKSEIRKKISALIVKGFTNKEISLEIGLCFSTVNTHLNSIYGKLLINSKAELVYLLCTDKSILTNNEKG